jgi:formamidase
MPDTLIKVDLTQSAYENDMIHNRWHPDVPMVAWVNPGDDFIVETYDWTGGFIKNNDSADDVRDIDLSIVHFLSGPIGVKGAEPGDLLVVDLLDVGPVKESLWGFNGFFSKQNGGGFLTDHFPLAQKSIWDFKGMYTSSRHVPGVNFAGLIHPGLIGCLPDPKLLATWNERETALIATNPTRVPGLANPPFGPTAHMGRLKGDAKAKAAAEGARTVPPREHGGNCDIKDLSRGSKVYFPVYVPGGGLSMGDLHFSQGDGEITFCGAIEMAGWLHLKVDIIKDGVAKYGIKNPVFKPSPGLPERDRVPQEVRLFRRAGLFDSGNGAVSGAYLRRGRRAQCLRDAVAADGNLRLRHHAVVGWSDQTHQGRHPDAAVTGQIAPATGCGTARICRPASAVANDSVFERSMPSDSSRGWAPVRVKKTWQNKTLNLNCARNENAGLRISLQRLRPVHRHAADGGMRCTAGLSAVRGRSAACDPDSAEFLLHAVGQAQGPRHQRTQRQRAEDRWRI